MISKHRPPTSSGLAYRLHLNGWLSPLAVCLSVALGVGAALQAQEVPKQRVPGPAPPAKPVSKPAPAQAAPKKKTPVTPKKKKVPPPVELGRNDLITSDAVQLSATFHPGTKGKQTVPVILLHMWKGDRKEFAELASVLQREHGHAVLVPDLRGHGGSTRVGYTGTLDAASLGPREFYDMTYRDMEALRRFLVMKNDEGELNLSNLCIVGAEMGAAVALYYAQYDWTTPRRESGAVRPAADVKALVLLSPEWAFSGLPLNKPLTNPFVRSRIAMAIVAGREDTKGFADARRAYKLVERFHPDPPDGDPAKDDLLFFQPGTKLQGTKMLGVEGLKVDGFIAWFIEQRLVKQDLPWRQRGGKN